MFNTLKGKLLSRFLFVAGFTLLIGGVSIFTTKLGQRDLNELSNNSVRSLELLGTLQSYSKEHILATVKMGYGDKADVNSFYDESKTANEKFHETMNNLVLDDDSKQLVNNVESKWQEYHKIADEVYKKASSVQTPEEEKKLHSFVAEDLELAKVEVVNSINDLANHYSTEAHETSVSATKTMSVALWITMITILVAFVLSSVIGYKISSDLSREFNSATTSLEQVMRELEDNAKKMLSNSQDLSSSTSTQAASVQETVTAMDEISSMLKRTEDGSKSSEDMASQSARLAKQGHESITSLQVGMQNISDGFNNVVVTFDEANKRFMDIINVIREIDAKTKVINEIVFQTKLLSFNASVEAARAGEHGKGFAVVAEEVGALAGMSGKSASEITEILNSGIQKVQTIIDQNRESIQRVLNNARSNVDSSKKYVIETQDALNEIVDNSDKTKNSTSEIVQFCREQTIAVQEITKAIYEIDKSTQHTNTVAHDSEDTAHSIETSINKLSDVTSNISYQVTGEPTTNTSLSLSTERASIATSTSSGHQKKKAA